MKDFYQQKILVSKIVFLYYSLTLYHLMFLGLIKPIL
nr:MAG TPA: hypothetical protein [Caudoviricetes sp.]